jgi:toxin FitB
MMVLDTNVVSAALNLQLNPIIAAWLDTIDRKTLATTSITIFEIRYGIDRKPPGRKRDMLEADYLTITTTLFPGRILPLDPDAADLAGRIDAKRMNEGREMDTNDAQIAAIAMTRGLPIVTRNVRHFDDLAVTIINPWEQAAGG